MYSSLSVLVGFAGGVTATVLALFATIVVLLSEVEKQAYDRGDRRTWDPKPGVGDGDGR